MIVSFPFEKRQSRIFAEVYRPMATVSFWSQKINGWVEVSMIVDSGSDYTLLPRYQAKNLGVNLEKECQPFLTDGVGGSETVYLLKNWRLKLANKELSAPVGFLDRDNIP